MIQKVIKIPIYGGQVTVILDDDLSYVERKYRTVSLKNYGAVTLQNKAHYKKYVMAFEYVTPSIVAHEVVHLVNYIFLDCGVQLDRENDEAQAYLTGWLVDKIYEILTS